MQAEKPSERELPTPFRKQGQQIQADGEVVATCDLWCREQVEAAIDAALSHPSTPQGWKLVPVEPTLDMGWAYLDAARADDPRGAEELRFSWPGYRAMLNAAPPPPEQGGKG